MVKRTALLVKIGRNTHIQSLINRLDQLQTDMNTTKELWGEATEKIVTLDQRLRLIEYELAIV